MMARYYVTSDQSGMINGTYCDDVHDVIPAGAIEITTDQWLDMIGTQHLKKYSVKGNKLVVATDTQLLPRVRQFKMNELKDGYNTSCSTSFTFDGHTFGNGVNDRMERSTTLNLLTLDQSMDTVDVDTIDGVITMTRDEFIALVLESNAVRKPHQNRLSQLTDLVNTATTHADIHAIKWQ